MFLPWKISTRLSVSSSNCDSLSGRCVKSGGSGIVKFPCCCVKIQDIAIAVESQLRPNNDDKREFTKVQDDPRGVEGQGQGENKNISGIQVPRQRFIAISKSELLDAILMMFDSQEEIDQFLVLSSCLDSILHAEHKSILEEMRFDYNLTQSTDKKKNSSNGSAGSESEDIPNGNESNSPIENTIGMGSMAEYREDKIQTDTPMAIGFSLNLRHLLGSLNKNVNQNSLTKSRISVATRFQRAFVQLLYNAQFEELSARDLRLTSALNSDYLLTLPIYVDWKRASESNAIIFRRGYATERQKGLLIGEKLDYLQSKLLQGIFRIISQPLGKVGIWITEAFKSAIQGQNAQIWSERANRWLKELPIFQQSYAFSEQTSDNLLQVDQLSSDELPIWLAAQRAVSRYEGLLSPVGPRGRLLRKLLMWVGLIPSIAKETFDLESDVTATEPYLRPIFLSRITLSDIWKPATRKYCGNDFWKILKNAISLLFSQSVLQEPAFQELILLFTEERDEEEIEDTAEIPLLQLKIYEKISIPDLPVIFPHKKLSFRILDTVRLDVATILGLLAYFINYKFEDILSSPSAILLDVIAFSTLIIYVTRVALGYKQTWDRYQLLVNKTLYEKTLASGFGSVHFLLDASEQQQYKEAILAYAILLKAETSQATCPKNVKDKCERFMYNMFKEQVEMPVDKAIDTLMRLDLVTEKIIDQKIILRAIPCPKACDVLKQRWNSLLN
ncbi:MAP protein [Actinidia chinensis var. chinensis]|uniref:MAP protein n=1 Tax=Actinidia chinensis var. chinensis TaxID=1590841 RepID=A0A2R6RCC5_ACTCC|nr:MAP protein [Actinidia chinensis var. chinensis]